LTSPWHFRTCSSEQFSGLSFSCSGFWQHPLFSHMVTCPFVRHRLPLSLVFALHATGSMDPYIQGVKNALIRFLDALSQGGLDAALGAVLFRDEQYGEKPQVIPLGTNYKELQDILQSAKADGGGDLPESSYPALMRAVAMLALAPPGAVRQVLHIADAPPHDPEQASAGDPYLAAGTQFTQDTVRSALKQDRILYFGCTKLIEPYRSFANVTGGTLFELQEDMDAKTFEATLDAVALTTVKTVRVSPAEISDEVRALLNGV